MNKTTALLLKAYANMSEDEQYNFTQEIVKYIEADIRNKSLLKEGYEKRAFAMDLGPLSQGACPVFGRR